jgi:hypothetical protein
MKRKFLLTLVALAAFSGGASATRAFATIPPGGDCANTICGGVTYCNYGAGYSCSLTSNSCTNRFCTASAEEAATVAKAE